MRRHILSMTCRTNYERISPTNQSILSIAAVEVPIALQQQRPDGVPGGNQRRHTAVTPVVGNRERRGRVVVEIFEADEIERLVGHLG